MTAIPTAAHSQLIASGQFGQQVDHVLKAVMVDSKNTQDIKQYLKVMVDIVQVQMQNIIRVIPRPAQVVVAAVVAANLIQTVNQKMGTAATFLSIIEV